jgi:adenine-specific DNA-methyltransferase
MIKPEPMEQTSQKITEEQKAKLRQLFPEVFTEGKVDFDRLKLTLGEEADDGVERYGMSWPGKRDCFKVIQQPSAGTLKPCKAESVNFDDTENLFIEGDNLEALKLLQKSYYGKIKMIYIDPPYNTGKEFIYPDNFKENLDTYLEYTGQTDESGRKFSTNTESEGRFHSKWLNMMYPRLFLARNLLRDDGVIFISIDDNEVSNLRKLCDEIFGEENFVANFIWEKRTNRENRKVVSARHDYLLCYCKRNSAEERMLAQLPMNDKALASYKNPDNDTRGLWKSDPATAQAGHGTKSQFYDLKAPNGKIHKLESGRCWLYTESVMQTAIIDNRIWFGKDGNGVPRIKTYLNSKERGLTPETIFFANEVTTTEIAKNKLKELFDGVAMFDTPKPVELLKLLLQLSVDDGVVLDFFAGSATTAHAVLELNKEDGGNRKFIMVQLPEPCDEQSEAFKAGYKTIAEIGKERIRRVIQKITTENTENTEKEKADNPLFHQDKASVSSVSSVVQPPGFKVFKLDRSNFKAWQAEATDGITAEAISKQLELGVDHIDPKSTPDDILYELLMKSGFELTAKVATLKLANKTVYSIAGGALLICLEPALTKEVITAMAKLSPARVLCLDRGFAGNDQLKTNAVQIMKSHEVEDFRTV